MNQTDDPLVRLAKEYQANPKLDTRLQYTLANMSADHLDDIVQVFAEGIFKSPQLVQIGANEYTLIGGAMRLELSYRELIGLLREDMFDKYRMHQEATYRRPPDNSEGSLFPDEGEWNKP